MKPSESTADPVGTVVTAERSEEWRSVGGKGRNLQVLSASGFRVPRWSVIAPDVLDQLLSRRGLTEHLDGLLARLTPGDATPTTVTAVAIQISELLAGAHADEEFTAAVRAAHEAAGGARRVAVRSSALEEDGDQHSFAGQFDSFLNVTGPDLPAHVLRCWASAWSERSLHYRARRGLATPRRGLAVIVQEMVDAQRSGVLFTANPVTGATGEYVVSACHGLGDGLMSGTADADTVVLAASTGERLETTIGTGHGEPALDERALAELHDLGTAVSAVFGAPQDIEWALADGVLHLLQSRPITTLPATAPPGGPEPAGELRIWDNSNIIESFGGVVSPLTFSFANEAYGLVYLSYARSLRLPEAQLRQVAEWTPVMLGYVHGRVYYNLFHWYRMVRLAPLYPLGRRVMEKAVGVEESLSDEQAGGLHPWTAPGPLRGRLVRARSTVAFTRRFLTMHRRVDRFTREFYRSYEVFDGVDYDALPGDETLRRFRDLERDLIERWGPMMALDASILLSVGGLALLTRRWLPEAPEWFVWAAGSPGADVESAEPARALTRLAELVRADEAVRALIDSTEPEHAYAALRDGGHTGVLEAVDRYVADYGYRSPDELKLESPDLREDPSGLFVLLRGALHEVTTDRRAEVGAYLDEHLRGPRRWVYELARRRVATCLADRERLRFCRTRAFGAAKRALRALGRDLARIGAIEDWRDVFLLRIEELRGAYEGTVAHAELPLLVALRRRLLEQDAALRAPSRFETRGAVYWQGNLERAGWGAEAGRAAGRGASSLRGVPSCPGVVEGRAVVMDTPGDAGGGVLVAYRTDPGWVPALMSASALVIERGSPLTHVAVVARELGVPTVVQVKDATRELVTGMRVRLDGSTGAITVLDRDGDRDHAGGDRDGERGAGSA